MGPMFKSLMDFIDGLAPLDGAAAARKPSIQLAAAVLLVEVMRADADYSQLERAAVRRALIELFPQSESEADVLMTQAESSSRMASDLFAFTSPIDELWDMPAKLRLVELMWGVAYADGRLSEIERHTMLRIVYLLHIPPGAQVHARMRAKAAAGLDHED